MTTQITQSNGGDAPEAPTTSKTTYLCQPLRGHKRIACTVCGDSFGEPFIRFFLHGDLDFPVCRKCALRYGFIILRNRGAPLRCRRGKGGAIELSEEWTRDRELDDALDRWLTGFQDERMDDEPYHEFKIRSETARMNEQSNSTVRLYSARRSQE